MAEPMKKREQIGGDVTADEHSRFRNYAAQFHLTESGLANLLIVRELKLRRLANRPELYSPSPHATRSRTRARPRVTAHQSDAALKVAWEALAAGIGIGPDQAASAVFRAELVEKWLESALLQDWNHIDSTT